MMIDKTVAKNMLLHSVIWAFALFGLLFILLLLIILGMLKQSPANVVEIPSSAILTIDFDKKYTEIRTDDLLTEIAETQPMSFFDLISAINIAVLDNRVKAIVGTVNESELGLAQIQELRQNIELFKSRGKKAYIYSSGMGSFGNGTGEYYLATAFDEIWMQPTTEVGITGLSIEVPFLKKLLDKVGITPEFYTRYEYKNAVASLLNFEMSPQYKSELQKMGESIFGVMTNEIALKRNISEKELSEIINNAPIEAEKALEKGLIDKIAYRQDLMEQIQKDLKAKTIKISDYALDFGTERRKLPTIAFLVIDGEIVEGESSLNSIRDEAQVGSNSVVEQIEKIAKDKYVKALVVRVNSPGGSYTASKEIWYALKKLKDRKNIPVVISQGDYAASGGYFVSLAGDYIVSEPSSITGSIGVLGGKMVLNELWEKIDVNWGSVNFGQNAGILSMNHKFSPQEKKIFNRSLDNIYNDFTQTVAEARKIDIKEMNKIARGRVWTGIEALNLGLVDELGGINEALIEAKKQAGIESGDKFEIAYYPEKKSLTEKIADLISGTPKISVNKIMMDLGIENNNISMLKRLKYETALPPMSLSF